MPLRSILEIDVNDDAFKRFAEQFDRYKKAVDQLQPAWAAANTAALATKSDMADMSAILLAHTETLVRATRASEGLGRSLGTVESVTKRIAGNIADATRDLLRWSTIATGITGLVGLGGLFGLERLAQSASNMRRSAEGLGTSPAEQQAFRTNLNRVIDTNSFLAGVNDALNDVSKRWTLQAAGLLPQQFSTQNTTQVALALLPELKRIVDTAPAGQLQQILQSRGLNQFLSTEDAIRLRNTPQSELSSFINRVPRDVRGFQIQDEDLKKWQDFNVQLERAGNTIYNALIRGLVNAAPHLEKLSGAVANAVEAFLKSDTFKHWVDEASEGLKWLGDNIDTPEFRQNVQDFTAGLGALAEKIIWVLKKLGIIPGGDATEAGIVGGAFAGGAIGGAVAGAPGMLVGGFVGAVAGGTAMTGSAQGEVWNEALSKWERDKSLGRDRRSFSEFQRDFSQAHPDIANPPAASVPLPPPIPSGGTPGAGSGSTGPRSSVDTTGMTNAQKEIAFHNYAGMMVPGTHTLMQFRSDDEGLQRIASQLDRYQQNPERYRHPSQFPVGSLGWMVTQWAPPEDRNQTDVLIAQAAKVTGLDPGDPVNMQDPNIRRRMVEAFIRNERGGKLPAGAEEALRRFGQAGAGFGSSIGSALANAIIPSTEAGTMGWARLAPYATGNARPGGPSSIAGINPEFADRIARMVEAMPPDVRAKFQIISGFRDAAREHQVNPSVTNSHHSFGMAVDTTWDADVRSWITAHGAEFGVGYTIANLPREGNHLEPTEGGMRIPPSQMREWARAHMRVIRAVPPEAKSPAPEVPSSEPEVSKPIPADRRNPGLALHIYNQTGGGAAVTMSQAAV